jgi:broad specificity phosphatase PhoE
MIKIKIIRHSERLDYTYPIYWLFYIGYYWADSPLTINGHKMANDKGKELASSNFRPKIIYTSPYTRAMATATEIKNSFPDAEIIIEPLLAEYQPMYKHRIGLYPEGIPTTYDGTKTEFSYPESEDFFCKRVIFIISKLIDKNCNDFIIITHGKFLKAYINHLQLLYPDVMLDINNVDYLTTLSFECDDSKKIIETSIRIE